MKYILILNLCFLLGCSSDSSPAVPVKKGWSWPSLPSLPSFSKAKEVIGLGPSLSPEEIAQKEQEQREKEQLERELAAQRLKDSDLLVAKWAEKVEGPDTHGSGFSTHIEGLTEIDPWGQPIKVQYHQEWFTEYATISSAGPDATFGNNDDLIRTRKATNILGIFSGISSFGWFLLIWITCIVLATVFSLAIGQRRLKKGKSNRHKHPLLTIATTAVFAPIVALVYGFQFLGGAIGADGDFFDGFDFDFDIDIDIDIL